MSELTVEEVPKLKVADLKTELAARDLPTKGLKKELVERLTEALQSGGSQTDPAGQTSGEAPQLADAAQANSESLPSELPAVPPANEDSVQDLEGAEPKLSEEKASNGVETAPGQSEVVRPDVNSLDQTPGVVSSTGAPETDANGTTDVGEKRKRDDEPAVLPLNGAPESVAAQAETAQPGNDSVPAPPADVEEPDTKRLKTDGEDAGAAAGSADIPVPSATSDIPVPEQSSDASASLLPPQADPILPLNEAIVPDTSSSAAVAAPGPEDPKSVQTSSSTVNGTASSSSSSSTLSLPTTADPNNLLSRKSVSIKGGGADRQSGNSVGDRSSSRMAKIGTVTPDTSVDSDRRGSSNSVAKMSHTIATQNEKMQLDDHSSASAADEGRGQMDTDAPHQSGSTPSQPIAAAPNDALYSSADPLLNTDEHAKTADNDKPPPSTSICVSNLVRPFTLPSLKEKLEEFGSYSYFWINAVKSHCYVTYDTVETAEKVSSALDGIIWPDRTGKILRAIYIPDSEVPRLVAAEKAAGRARLELVVKQDAEASEWQYEVQAPSAVTSAGNGKAAVSVRGLASAVPSAARPSTSNPFPLGTPASAPPTSLASRAGAGPPGNRIFQQANANRTSVVTVSGASIQIPRSSAFSQSTIPAGPAFASTVEPLRRLDEDRIWQPARGAESTYKQTQSMPKIWFRPVDAVTAGRKLRDLAREEMRAAPRRQSGIRDSYRP